jgi:predicted secreted Zn-dependent protease
MPSHPLPILPAPRRRIAPLLLLLIACARPAAEPAGVSPVRPATSRALRVTRETTHYDLVSTSLASILEEKRQLQGRGRAPSMFGRTDWTLALRPASGGARTRCDVRPVVAEIELRTMLPRAVRADQFSDADRREWGRFLAALTAHETGHDSVVIERARDFLEGPESDRILRALQVRSLAECQQHLLQSIARASAKYDSVTRHGVATGASLRVRAR